MDRMGLCVRGVQSLKDKVSVEDTAGRGGGRAQSKMLWHI